MGDPGSGKTRLLAEAVDRFAPDDTARIVGYEPEQSVPLAACAELLQTLSAAPAGRGLRLLFEQGTSSLAPMQVFEAAHRALDACERLLVTVDDLQWVDELSLALCHYLVRAGQAAAQPLVLIAAARPSAEAATLAASLRQVLPSDRFASLTLGPLTAEESLQLVEALAPRTDAATARTVAERAQGSPFWLEALARPGGSAADAAQLVTARLRGAGAPPHTPRRGWSSAACLDRRQRRPRRGTHALAEHRSRRARGRAGEPCGRARALVTCGGTSRRAVAASIGAPRRFALRLRARGRRRGAVVPRTRGRRRCRRRGVPARARGARGVDGTLDATRRRTRPNARVRGDAAGSSNCRGGRR